MPTYAMLTRYTAEGIKDFKQRNLEGKAIERWRQLGETLGCRVTAAYVTMGHYDGVAIVDAPDDNAVAQLALALAGSGVWSTETMRAFTPDEIQQLAAGLP